VFQGPHLDPLEAHLVEQSQPGGAREQPLDVPVVHRAQWLALHVQQVCEVDEIGRVVGVGIPGPHQVAQAAFRLVVAAILDLVDEGLAHVVRRKDRDAARPAVHPGGPHRTLQVSLRGHVAHRVVDEDRIEDAVQPQLAHVALDVLALRIQARAHGEHGRGDVAERDLGHPDLVVRGHVAAATAKLEQVVRRRAERVAHDPHEEGGFLGVLVGRGQQVVPGC
jgi:hypothetical protein